MPPAQASRAHPLPATMQQAVFSAAGGPDVIVIEQAPVPRPGPGQVLLKLAAAGINRPDCLQRAGLYPAPPGTTPVPGLEGAGEVVAVGEGIPASMIGENLCALLNGGGYAEYALAEEALCLPVPHTCTMVEAAAIPETFFTVYDNVFSRGRLRPGEVFLVHGGASGIGSTAIQLAARAGATVFATAGGPEKVAFCKKLGAHHVIDHRASDFVEEIKRINGKRGVDVILDMVGGDYILKNLSLLGVEGRLVQIAFLEGSKTSIDLMPLMLKRLTITGSTLRARSNALKAEIAAKVSQHVWPLIEAGKVKPILDRTFPLAQAREAHALMESGTHKGKIVLTMG
jgi:NADPH:quinone reductase